MKYVEVSTAHKHMFDLGLIKSYVAYLREEGGSCLLSSLPSFSNTDLKKFSLPLLSWAYFSSEEERRLKLLSLIDRDRERKSVITGNDIFREDDVAIYKDKVRIYRRAISLIDSVWPEYSRVIDIIQPRLSLTVSEDLFESASDPKTFGQITYSMDSDSPVKWAEIIVHELGHHYLNIVVTTHDDQEIFSQPWDESKYSAIRETDRPLIGIYHGAFAEACMISLALRILKNRETSQDYRLTAIRMIERFGPIFNKDYQTICENKVIAFDKRIQRSIESVRQQLLKFESKEERRFKEAS